MKSKYSIRYTDESVPDCSPIMRTLAIDLDSVEAFEYYLRPNSIHEYLPKIELDFYIHGKQYILVGEPAEKLYEVLMERCYE